MCIGGGYLKKINKRVIVIVVSHAVLLEDPAEGEENKYRGK